MAGLLLALEAANLRLQTAYLQPVAAAELRLEAANLRPKLGGLLAELGLRLLGLSPPPPTHPADAGHHPVNSAKQLIW